MKPPKFAYARPTSLAEAVELRAEHAADSALLAGGQSLIPLLNFRMARPAVVIDLGGVDGLATLEERDGGIAVGAMTRQRRLELDERAHAVNPLLRETLRLVAHAVVRNRGTVVGSIAHADPAAELPTLFATLDGRAVAVSRSGERMIVGGDLFEFHMTTTLAPEEVLREVWFPALPPRTGWAFFEVARRHGDYALAGVCCTATLGEDGVFREVRIGCSGVAPRPARARAAEELLAGRAPDAEALREAAARARDVVEAADDVAASQALRRRLVETLTQRALRTAVERARGAG